MVSIILVKLGFSKDEVGQFEWFIYLYNVGTFFWALGIKNALVSFYPKLGITQRSQLKPTLSLLFLGLGIILSLGYFIFVNQSLLLLIFITLSVTSSLTEHFLILDQKSQSIFYYSLLSYGAYVILIFGCGTTENIEDLFLALVLWAGMRFIYFIYYLFQGNEWKIDISTVKKLVLIAIPLILQMLLGNGMEYVDGFIIERYLGIEEFAVFRYGAKELPINTIFITALVTTSVPLAVKMMHQTLNDVRHRTTRLMHILFPLSMILVLISPILFKIIYSEEYAISAYIFNIYMLILVTRIILPQIALYAKDEFRIFFYISLVEFAVNIILSLVFLKYFGILGVAAATVVAYFIERILLVVYTKWKLGIPVNQYVNLKLHIMYSIGLYACFGLSVYLYN